MSTARNGTVSLAYTLHQDDLPDGIDFGEIVAIDTETMGLNVPRDRLCLIQLSDGSGKVHLVQFRDRNYEAPRLKALIEDPAVTKLFHFGRFDIAVMQHYLGVLAGPVYCTKIAAKLTRTFTDRYGLKDLCKDLIGKDISKQQQTSDWGARELSADQLKYAASDVLYLHALKTKLDELLVREGRTALAQAAFDFLPTRALLDLAGWKDVDIFSHS